VHPTLRFIGLALAGLLGAVGLIVVGVGAAILIVSVIAGVF
jgi:hypothetical protein